MTAYRHAGSHTRFIAQSRSDLDRTNLSASQALSDEISTLSKKVGLLEHPDAACQPGPVRG